jgi:hypothetical protein
MMHLKLYLMLIMAKFSYSSSVEDRNSFVVRPDPPELLKEERFEKESATEVHELTDDLKC